MSYSIQEEKGFKYYEAGDGQVLLLLHGLFGALSNFQHVIQRFSDKWKVSIPILPLFDLPVEQTSVGGMVKYVEEFIQLKGYKSVVVLGNSLGGHIALMYALANLNKVRAIVLTGSSGLFENSLGDSYPKKGDYQYVKEKTEYTFYNPEVATKELVDEVFEIVNNREKAIRVLYVARSALRHNLREHLHELNVPSLLVWGKEDRITPPKAAEEFHRLLPDSELNFIEECGHAAMMECPEEFNQVLGRFLDKLEMTHVVK